MERRGWKGGGQLEQGISKHGQIGKALKEGACVRAVVIAKGEVAGWLGEGGDSQEGGMTSEMTFGIKAGMSVSCGEEDAAIIRAGESRNLGKISDSKNRKE